MKKSLLLLAAILPTFFTSLTAQNFEEKIEWKNSWFVNAQIGGSLAFGDDSYNVFSDFNHANGSSLYLAVGKYITPQIGLRVKAGKARLYSRVNLETLDFKPDFPDLFPRDGFYGYNCYSVGADVMVNVLNLFMKDYGRRFDLYLLAGGGMNCIDGYQDHVEQWKQDAYVLPGGWYEVDTTSKNSAQASIGGQIDYRLGNNVSLMLEAVGTFTGDAMEGIVYEESYDVYITYTVGLTIRF